VLGLGSLLYALIEAPERGWVAGGTITWFAVALVILAGFFAWEQRATHPMLDLTLFRAPEFSTGSIVIMLGFLSMFGSFFLTTQYLQAVQGYSALEAGIRTLPLSVAMVLSSPRSARFVERYGARTVVSTGLLLLASGLASMAALTASSSYAQYVVGAVLMGLGMGQTMPPATSLIMGAVPRDRAGVGSAVNDVTREVGGAIGIAVLGSLLASRYRSSLDVDVPGADQGIGSALEAAGRLGVEGEVVRAAASDAFMSGWRVSFIVASAIVTIAAVLVRRLLATSPSADAPRHEIVPVS
jgi:predicted MFS family arabinose efflux permease